jgi:Ala-tRNA(Pro) deacylase
MAELQRSREADLSRCDVQVHPQSKEETMTIAQTVIGMLQSRNIPYEVVSHPYRESCRDVAVAAHVPPDHIAKAVILADRRGYLMAVLPGDRHISLEDLRKQLGRRLSLASENRLAPVFRDCESGAFPPLGPAYGMETIMDDRLIGLPEVFFEAGDHCGLIRVRGDEFLALMREARHGQFAH